MVFLYLGSKMLWLMVIASQFLSIDAKHECGVPKLYPKENRVEEKKLYIFEGEDALKGMFPWIGFLVFGEPFGYANCTVSLIQPRWLITAAHCVLGECAKDAWVIMGIAKREDMTDLNAYKVEYIFHPEILDFENNKTMVPMHDIAMLRLEKDVDIRGSNGTINTICLPKPEQNLTGSVFLSGWGFTAEEAPNPADSLKYIKADILPEITCLKKDKTKFCVRGVKKGQATYHGDSGGPAQMLIKGKYYLHGALSGGFKNSVAAYTIVKNYLDWIVNLPVNETVTLTECAPAENTSESETQSEPETESQSE